MKKIIKCSILSILIISIVLTNNVFAIAAVTTQDATSLYISKVQDICVSVKQGSKFILPSAVTAIMNDNSKKQVVINWGSYKANTSKVGTYLYYGTVQGYSKKVKFTLTVIKYIKNIADMNVSIKQGSKYTLPSTVIVAMSNGSKQLVKIKWNVLKIDTKKVGTYTYYGKVNGYDKKVKLKLAVNVSIRTLDQLNNYLNLKFKELNTPAGKWQFQFKVRENDSSSMPYDIKIETDWYGVSVPGMEESIKLSEKDKHKTKLMLAAYQKRIADIVLLNFPRKKIEGGFYAYGYEYPYIQEGYWSLKFLTWRNFESYPDTLNYYDNKVTNFHWYTKYDDYIFSPEISLKSIDLIEGNLNLNKGEMKKLHININPSNFTQKLNLKWSSDDESVATVDSNGVVTAKENGYACIRVEDKYGSASDILWIYVNP